MSTDPKKQDEIKDEDLENVSGGAASNSVESEADVGSDQPIGADVLARPKQGGIERI